MPRPLRNPAPSSELLRLRPVVGLAVRSVATLVRPRLTLVPGLRMSPIGRRLRAAFDAPERSALVLGPTGVRAR